MEKAGQGVGAGGGAVGQHIPGGGFEFRGGCRSVAQYNQQPVPGGAALSRGGGSQPGGR